MVRLARADDAAACAAIYRSAVENSWISFEETPPDAAVMRERITSIGATYPWLVYEDDEVRGFAYASKHRERAAYRWSIDVSVHVAAQARRRGVGRALLRGPVPHPRAAALPPRLRGDRAPQRGQPRAAPRRRLHLRRRVHRGRLQERCLGRRHLVAAADRLAARRGARPVRADPLRAARDLGAR